MAHEIIRDLSEEEMVQLLRNALLVAGEEMGHEGDHWPAIHATVNAVLRDWEELQVERAVHAEMKTHLYAQLEIMDRILPTCETEVQADVGPKLKELREIYDAYFTDIDESKLVLEDDEVPMHVKRAEAILDTLEDQNGEG